MSLERVLSRTRMRLRAQHALFALLWTLLVLGALCAAYALFQYAVHGQRVPPRWWLFLLALGPVVGALWPVSREEAAVRLDRAHDNADRLRAALDFSAREETSRSRFMEAAIRDAVARAESLSPARAAPWTFPHVGRFVPIALACFALVLALPERPPPQPPKVAKARPARLLTRDDLEAFRTELTAIDANATAGEVEEHRRSYEKLLEQIARGELDKALAIERLLALEKKLQELVNKKNGDAAALGELSREIGKVSEALNKALEQGDAAAAARELKRVAERLPSADKSQLAKLREALRSMEAKVSSRDARKKRAEELKSLLKKQEQSAALPRDKQLLERNKRELDKLERELSRERERNRELEQLDRNLADASRGLSQNDPQSAARELDEAARDLERFADQQRSEQQRDALSEQVSQLRQLMQQQRNAGDSGEGEGGPEKATLRQQFVQRARGESGDPQQGQIQRGGKGEGEDAQGGSREEKTGENGTMVLKPATSDQAPDLVMQLPGQTLTREREIGAPGASGEHDPRTLRTGTELEGNLRDSQVSGALGKGPSRSETILDAADRGFTTTSYRKVYTEYRGHAEQVLEKDEIPDGYRFYVRRYFQLIRPRDER